MDNQAMMITKVKNIYIMLLNAISKENISIVDHYLDDDLTLEFKEMIENNIKNNVRQVYRQPNITNISVVEEDDNYVTLRAQIRYISYFVNRKNGKFVSGDDKNRISQIKILKFRKNNLKSQTLYSCRHCGAGLNINISAICSYCGSPADERFSQYVLCSISSEEVSDEYME